MAGDRNWKIGGVRNARAGEKWLGSAQCGFFGRNLCGLGCAWASAMNYGFQLAENNAYVS